MAYSGTPSATTGTAHIWGVTGGVTALTVTSASVSHKFNIEEVVEDEGGRIIHKRYDDPMYELSIDGIVKSSGTPPALGATISYDSRNYIITGTELRGENKGFQKYSIKGEHHTNSAPSSGT